MAVLKRKRELFSRFEDAIRLSGWNLLYLTNGQQNPARYQIFRDGYGGTVRVYMWNITHGGNNRPADEYRIQPTGIEEFELEPNGRTLVLGWWEDVGVFAGWDVRQHLGKFGKSPSFQINEAALQKALANTFAPYKKASGETAIAFRPDFAGTYVEFLEQLHDSGAVPAEAGLLEKLSDDPDSVTQKEIEDDVSAERKYAVSATKRALRALDFARRVLSAYEHQCAMCGTQMRLVEGAHILPVTHLDSNDKTHNGVALCVLHHRAYDRALVTFDPDLKIHINGSMVEKFKHDSLAGGLTTFEKNLRPFLVPAAAKADRPLKEFVKKANALRGWSV